MSHPHPIAEVVQNHLRNSIRRSRNALCACRPGPAVAAGQGADTPSPPFPSHHTPAETNAEAATEDNATLSRISCCKETSPLYPTHSRAEERGPQVSEPPTQTVYRSIPPASPTQAPASYPPFSHRPGAEGAWEKPGGWGGKRVVCAEPLLLPHPPPLGSLPRELFSIEGGNLPPVPRYRRQRATLPTHCQIRAASERARPH